MQEILSTIIFSCLGIILMMAGTFIVDLIVPCHFPTEIKNGNQSVGYITAGSSIAVGIILKGAVMSPSTIEITQGLLEGVGSTILYFFIGIIFCIIGYLVMKVFNKKYDLNKEITNGNPAAGLMVMGMFIGLAILISGVIY